MPTLQPQRLSGLVVTPTVEQGGGMWHGSVAIDVGMSRAGTPQVVSREDLVVELKNPSEGSFEPIASPDPGPLPTRALRVVQARAEFTYGGSVNPPTELVVSVKGDRKSFPMAQTYSPAACLGKEPATGDPFAATRPGTRPGIIIRLPVIGHIFGPRCRPRRFDAPLNVSVDATAKSEYFEMEGDFATRLPRFRCGCCEYRQFVRGTFTDAGGAAVRFDMPSGALDAVRWCEDGAIDEFAPGGHGYYGHRATSSPGDEYTGAGVVGPGCAYRAKEKPACPPAETAHLEFAGLIVDRCRGRVVAKRNWVVDL
jgi:hypothetical protein